MHYHIVHESDKTQSRDFHLIVMFWYGISTLVRVSLALLDTSHMVYYKSKWHILAYFHCFVLARAGLYLLYSFSQSLQEAYYESFRSKF